MPQSRPPDNLAHLEIGTLFVLAGGKYAAADLTDFVSKNKLPLVVAFSQQTGPLIFQSPVKKQVRGLTTIVRKSMKPPHRQ